jgi:DNA topoisomerase-3
MTAFNSKKAASTRPPVGRVQTPTLAIMVEREARIRAFVPRDYWEVEGEFQCVAGTTPGAGSTRNSRRPMTSTPGPSASGTRPGPMRSARPASASTARWKRRASPRPSLPDALRPHLAAARGQRPLRLSVPRTPGAGPGAVRKAQGPDLPAYRQPPPARGLPRHGQGNPDGDGGHPYATFRRRDTEEWLGAPQQAHLQQRQGERSLCHHPHRGAPKSLSEPSRRSTTWSPSASSPSSIPAAEYNITTRITRVEKEAFKTEGKVLVTPGWLAVYGKEAPGRRGNAEFAAAGEKRAHLGQGCRGQGQGRPSRRRASRKPRCSPPWKAPAS